MRRAGQLAIEDGEDCEYWNGQAQMRLFSGVGKETENVELDWLCHSSVRTVTVPYVRC